MELYYVLKVEFSSSFKQNEEDTNMKNITIETKDNGYKAEAVQTMIRKFDRAAAFLFPGCTVRHFYYGDALDMADVVLEPGRYAHFNITAKRVSLCGYTCSSAELEQFSGMTLNDECYKGDLLDLVARADGTKRERITPEEGKVYTNKGGGEFLCLTSYHGGDACMRNVKSGWTFMAHGVQQYENGTIEWDYSTGGHFDK